MATLIRGLSRSYLLRFAAATAGYAVVLYFSLLLVPPGGNGASLVWPPAVLGLAVLFFWGIDLWPAIAAAFFIVLIPRGIIPPLAATTAMGNVIEAVIGAYLLRNYTDFSPMLSRLRDTLLLVLAAVVATLSSATVIAAGVQIINQRPAFNAALWAGIAIGHAVSLISMGPFVLRWLYRPFFSKTAPEVIEGVAVFGSIFTLCVLLFWTPFNALGSVSLLYILIIPLIWAALRTGPRGITLSLFMLATIGASGTLFGYGPISQSPNLAQALFGIQMVVGTLALIFLLFTSITEERKEAVVQLERHVGQLEGALRKISSEDQAKSDFIAILAHELRNPLSPVLSGLEILKTKKSGPPEVLNMMGAHVHTIARLLDDLLDISRISQKKFHLQKQMVELRGAVERALEMVRPQIESRGHELSVALPQEELWLSADPVRLQQIFANLLGNASKYTDHGGRIALRARREDGYAVVEVEDTGVGIEPDRLEKVFEPFGGNERDLHRPGGLRIGLSLARRMAQMHHGTVTAKSGGRGKGSTFVVRLPLSPMLELPLPERPAGSRTRSRFSPEELQKSSERLGSGVDILLVDDNESAAQGLKKLLEHHGHLVRVAYDAPEAIALADERAPQVALLDIGLPTMDGFRLGELLRGKCGDDLILIALTGYGQEDDRQKGKAAGFKEHLVKPVSITDVQRILAELLGR